MLTDRSQDGSKGCEIHGLRPVCPPFSKISRADSSHLVCRRPPISRGSFPLSSRTPSDPGRANTFARVTLSERAGAERPKRESNGSRESVPHDADSGSSHQNPSLLTVHLSCYHSARARRFPPPILGLHPDQPNRHSLCRHNWIPQSPHHPA